MPIDRSQQTDELFAIWRDVDDAIPESADPQVVSGFLKIHDQIQALVDSQKIQDERFSAMTTSLRTRLGEYAQRFGIDEPASAA